jgi:ATP-dependent protease Clp ATPase subunit
MCVQDNSKPELFCSFCNKSQHEVLKLVAGSAAFICNECTLLCMSTIAQVTDIEESFSSVGELLQKGGLEKARGTVNGYEILGAVLKGLEVRGREREDIKKREELKKRIDDLTGESAQRLEVELAPLRQQLAALS